MESKPRKHEIFGLILAIVMSFLQLSCGRSSALEGSPTEFLRAFLSAVEWQDSEKVWDFLSQETQAILQAEQRALLARLPKSKLAPHQFLRFGHVLSSTREYKKFELLRQTESEAIVGIHRQDGAILEVTLKKEAGQWKLTLPLSQ